MSGSSVMPEPPSSSERPSSGEAPSSSEPSSSGGATTPVPSRPLPARRGRWRHPVNEMMIEQAPLGARIADRVTGFLGSWTFLIIQTIFVAIWIAGNVYLLFNFDPFPFILLNLAFSTQAAYAAPLILLAGNRASIRDRLTLEHAAAQSDVEEQQNEALLSGNIQILERIEGLEKQILELETRILAAVSGHARPANDGGGDQSDGGAPG